MATINFTNTDLSHLTGLLFNPGIEDILDPNGTVSFTPGAPDPDIFTITNNDGGPFNGFKFEITGDGLNVEGTAGTITSIRILAPDGEQIATVTGLFSDNSLNNFYTGLLIDPAGGVLAALDNLIGNGSVMNGSAIADHLSAFGSSTLIGHAGDDVLRIAESGSYDIHGAEQNGDGGDAEVDTLELIAKTNDGVSADLDDVTDIDALRFTVFDPGAPVLGDTNFSLNLDMDDIAVGVLSPTLAVEGSTTPFSEIGIYFYADTSPSNTTPVVFDLSGWTFTNWNDDQNVIEIRTNYTVAANDSITGSAVHDYIETYAGDDTLQGGAGGDQLYGGLGNDTFVYGANEAGEDEYVSGGDESGTDLDKVVLLGSNDFGDTNFNDIDQIVFQGAGASSFSQWSLDMWDGQVVTIIGDGNANGLDFLLQKDPGYPSAIDLSDLLFQSWTAGSDLVSIRGTNAKDIITGSTQNDVIAGGKGSDDLQGNEGSDAFLFDFALGKGADHIADFDRKEGDTIQLAASVFDELKAGKLKKSAFEIGTEAESKKDHIIYDKESGILRYDDDGSGKHDSVIIAVLDNGANLKAADLFVV